MAAPNITEWSTWDFDLQVAANKVKGVTFENIFALNDSIGTTPQDVWNEGGVLSFLDTAETMLIASSSIDDNGNPEGNGAHRIRIFGLDENFLCIKEDLVLNGTTNVSTQTEFLRINKMLALDVGSAGVNVGNISATASISTTVQCLIGADQGNSLKSQFTIPEDYTGFIKNLSVGTENNDQALITPQGRSQGGSWNALYEINVNSLSYFQPFTIPLKIRSKNDLRIQAVNLSGATVSVSTNYEMYLVRNEFVTQENIFS